MPSLLDAADAFSKLEKSSVEIHEAACVRVRHRHASCWACMHVCAHDAITIENNNLTVDSALCTGCGACTSVCPTEALVLTNDANDLVRSAIDRSEPQSTLSLFCERAHSKQMLHAADPNMRNILERSITLPCLAALDESSLIHAACAEVELHYFSADCAQCPDQNCALIEDIALQATKLLAGATASCTEAPLAVCMPHWSMLCDRSSAQDDDVSPEMSRRGMFNHFIARTTDSVAEAAVGSFYAMQHTGEQPLSLAESLKGSQGGLKKVEVRRNAAILDDLYRVDRPTAQDTSDSPEECEPTTQDARIPTRLFGEAILDAQRCDLCGICMTFCPTQALRGDAASPVNPLVAATREIAPEGKLSFRANDCVNCSLCVAICPHNAIEIKPEIARSDLFALEPRTLLVR
jgi:ferredoxin